jgi:hypothetical protein
MCLFRDMTAPRIDDQHVRHPHHKGGWACDTIVGRDLPGLLDRDLTHVIHIMSFLRRNSRRFGLAEIMHSAAFPKSVQSPDSSIPYA